MTDIGLVLTGFLLGAGVVFFVLWQIEMVNERDQYRAEIKRLESRRGR